MVQGPGSGSGPRIKGSAFSGHPVIDVMIKGPFTAEGTLSLKLVN